MEKSSSRLLASLMLPLMAAALTAQSCAAGETPGTGTGTGGSSSTGTGGSSSTGTGGSSSTGTGGSSSTGTGGRPSTGTGGSSSTGTGGSSSTGTGGSSSTGTGGSVIGGATGGAGGAPATGGALTVAAGHVTSGTWKGYGYTFVGPATGSKATVAPADFKMATTLCATGMIAADTTYGSVAGMGFNVNQEVATTATEPPIGTTATTGAGLMVNVSMASGLTLAAGAGSQLRAQIKVSADVSYCAPIPATGVSMIPWGMFNKTCWEPAGPMAAPFVAGTAISAIQLVIPSALTAVGPFNICLTDARPY